MAGVTEKLDLGVKYTFPTTGSLEGKYCLIGAGKEKGVFIASGLRAGYVSISSDTMILMNLLETPE